MPKKALRNARAGSLPEPEASASSPDVSSFLQTLTDRQLQVMLSGLHQMFTRDEMTRLNMDIDKIVTTVSVKAIIPALCQSLNVDARSIFIVRPGSSNLHLESVTKEVSDAIVKTILDALEESQDSHKLELHKSATEKTELLASSCGSVELFKSSKSVEPSTKKLTFKDQAKLQECDIHTNYHAEDLKTELDLVNLSNMAGKRETSVPGQTLRNGSSRTSIFADELLAQLDLFTESEVSEDDQSAHRQCSSDTSLISSLLVDHSMAYVRKVSDSSFGHGIPATALHHQKHPFLRGLSDKSLRTLRSEDTRKKAAHEVSKILFMTADRFLESSLHSQSPEDCSEERSPSECLFRAFNLVDCVIDGIYERLYSRYKTVDWMESGADVSESLWYIACTTYYRTMRHLKDFSAVYQQKSPVSPEHAILLSAVPTPQAHLHKPTWFIDQQRRREMASMATFLDTMMASLGLLSSGHLNSLQDISAAAERVDGLFLTAATEEFARMLQLMLTERFCEKVSFHSFLHQSFATEFIREFADESVKRLLTSCIAPRAASAASENIPTLVMPFRACAESFEFSRPPSEVFEDTIDLFADVIVNSVMDKISEMSDDELDELSNAEETPSSVQSGSSSSIKEEPSVSSQRTDDVTLPSQDSSRGLVKLDRQHHACLTTWLVLWVLGRLEPTSSDLRKEASSDDPKELTERILRELSASSSAAKLEEVLNGTFDELLQRFGEEGSLSKALDPRDPIFDEALMTALQKHLGADASTTVPKTEGVKNMPSKKRKGIFFHLKMPKLSMFKKKSRKDNNGGHADQDPLQSRPTSDMGGSSNVTAKQEKPRKPSVFRRMLSCFRKSAVFCC